MKAKLLILLLVIHCCALISNAKGNGSQLRYDIECTGQEGMSGTYMVMAWVYNSKANISTDVIKEAAIRGVLFRGFQGDRCKGQKPMISNPATESDKADFFNTFFSQGGRYLNFATVLDSSFEVIKLSKKEYKIGMVVSVSKEELRKTLEEAGVIRKLSSGF